MNAYTAKDVKLDDMEDGGRSSGSIMISTASKKADTGGESKKLDFLIHYNSSFIAWWEIFIILVAIINSITIPFQVFYGEWIITSLNTDMFAIIDSFIDQIFIIDIVLNFRTTYLDRNSGTEIRDPELIKNRYLRGSFLIDLISSFPFFSFFQPFVPEGPFLSFLSALGLLKLIRLSRIYPTLRKQNLSSEKKIIIKLFLMMFIVVVALHMFSSVWFFFVSENQRWVHNMDFMYNGQDTAYQPYFEADAEDENFWRRYLIMMYTGFYLFGVGEVVPRSSWQEFFGAFMLLAFSQIANAAIIGFILTYMEELNRESSEYSKKISLCNTAMLNLKLSTPLKTEIMKFVMSTHHTKKLQQEYEYFMKDLTPYYQSKVTSETMHEITTKNFILKTSIDRYVQMQMKQTGTKGQKKEKEFHQNAITYLVQKLSSKFSTPGMKYIQIEDACHIYPDEAKKDMENEGNEDEIAEDNENIQEAFMYFIRSGIYSVSFNPPSKSQGLDTDKNNENNQKPKTLKLGDHFGEIGLIYGCKRTATVQSENYGQLALLTKSNLLELQKIFEGI